MAQKPPTRTISPTPFFNRIGDKPGAAARFARQAGISHQRLTNWKRRGIPAAELPNVATAIGLTVEEYLREAGAPTTSAHQPAASYLTSDELELIALYRAASGRWKLAIKHMARLRGDAVQDEAAESVSAIFAKIAANPIADERVAAAYGSAPIPTPKLPR